MVCGYRKLHEVQASVHRKPISERPKPSTPSLLRSHVRQVWETQLHDQPQSEGVQENRLSV